LLRTFIAARLYKDYDLVLIGARSEPYKDFDQLRSSLTNTQQQSVICLNDGVDNESLLVWLKHSEIVVYPSLAEGFGLPPLEAYILGCNVICFNNTAMLAFDFLEEGLIKDDQLQVVLPQALNLLKEGVLSRFPVRYQPEKVFENYSWERNAKIFYHLLTEKGKTRERNGIS
jgi:glycosyltransferase involved in cell wall biosynthesis